jgi:hypothetical protein
MTQSSSSMSNDDTSNALAESGRQLHYSSEHQEQGIARSWLEVFEVGSFRYTSLSDAVAQARRLRLGK